MKQIAKIVFLDNIKGKVVIIYFLMLALIAWTSLLLEDNDSKSALTMLNIILFITPLMSLLYTTIYLYNSREFVNLLLSQPLARKGIWHSLYCGIAISLLLAFLLGAGIPIMLYTEATTAFMLITMGTVITLIFISIAFLTMIIANDKTHGIGMAILIWLFFTMIYDAVCLYFLFLLTDYPIEKPIMGLLMLNPLDLARFQVILKMDAAAMMGYSGAAFKTFLGDTLGVIISSILLLLWIIVPYQISLRLFKKKDL